MNARKLIWIAVLLFSFGCSRATLEKGTVYLQQGRYDKAVAVLEKVVRKDGRNSEARTQLGIAYLGLGDANGARRSFRLAILYDADKAPAHFYLGQIQLDAGRFREAAESFETVVRLDASVTPALYFAGVAYMEAGQRTEAEGRLRTFLEQRGSMSPDDASRDAETRITALAEQRILAEQRATLARRAQEQKQQNEAHTRQAAALQVAQAERMLAALMQELVRRNAAAAQREAPPPPPPVTYALPNPEQTESAREQDVREVDEAAVEATNQLGDTGEMIAALCKPAAGAVLQAVAEHGANYAFSKVGDAVRDKFGAIPAELLKQALSALWSSYGEGLSAMHTEAAAQRMCPIVAHWIERQL